MSPKFTMKQQSSSSSGNFQRELLPDGEVYAADVQNVELRDSFFDDPDNPGQKRKEVNFRFRITEPGKFQGRVVFGSTPPWFNSSDNCTLRHWSEAILNVQKLPESMMDGTEPFDTDDLIGLQCRVAMAVRQKKKPNADGSPAFSNFVRDVLPSRAVQSAEEIFGGP